MSNRMSGLETAITSRIDGLESNFNQLSTKVAVLEGNKGGSFASPKIDVDKEDISGNAGSGEVVTDAVFQLDFEIDDGLE